jgi:hypothetical protein
MINPHGWPLFHTVKMFPISWAIKSTSASKIFLYWHKSGDKSLYRLYQIIKETTKKYINSIRRNIL